MIKKIHRRHGFGKIPKIIKNTVGDMVSAKTQIVATVKKYGHCEKDSLFNSSSN